MLSNVKPTADELAVAHPRFAAMVLADFKDAEETPQEDQQIGGKPRAVWLLAAFNFAVPRRSRWPSFFDWSQNVSYGPAFAESSFIVNVELPNSFCERASEE